jgi:hypothetical protein
MEAGKHLSFAAATADGINKGSGGGGGGGGVGGGIAGGVLPPPGTNTRALIRGGGATTVTSPVTTPVEKANTDYIWSLSKTSTSDRVMTGIYPPSSPTLTKATAATLTSSWSLTLAPDVPLHSLLQRSVPYAQFSYFTHH